jgi:hypothetical protein
MEVRSRRSSGRSAFDPPESGEVKSRKGADMPVRRGKDKDGAYYQWGESGKKYRYETRNERSRQAAKKKAEKQGQAVKASR